MEAGHHGGPWEEGGGLESHLFHFGEAVPGQRGGVRRLWT